MDTTEHKDYADKWLCHRDNVLTVPRIAACVLLETRRALVQTILMSKISQIVF